MPPGKPPIFYPRGRGPGIIILLTLLALMLLSLAAYSTALDVRAEGFIIGRSAAYSYDAGAERVRDMRLILSGDHVTGAQVTCQKPKNDAGNYAVSATFSNGAESRSGQVTVYQGRGVEFFTVTIALDPISYYPSPSASGDCWRVG